MVTVEILRTSAIGLLLLCCSIIYAAGLHLFSLIAIVILLILFALQVKHLEQAMHKARFYGSRSSRR